MTYTVRVYNYLGEIGYDIFFGNEWITRFVGYNSKANAGDYCNRLNRERNYRI